MSSLHIFIFNIILTIINADQINSYFTQTNYELWCQENILSNTLFLYPNQIPIGIYHQSNIKSVIYHVIDDDDNNHDLFHVKTQRLADFYFFILNITRPFDINREYQDIYRLQIQANIFTTHRNITEQATINLHVADANDNDVVFDLDIYEKNLTEPFEIPQLLIHFHASDADEIHHAQILYEYSSLNFNEIFSLHPFTGELYLISNKHLQTIYEFDIYAYDRYRNFLINNNIKTKTHVKLRFNQNNNFYQFKTISNEMIQFKEVISLYHINFIDNFKLNFLNIHQPILTIEIFPIEFFYEIFILNNSSSNTKDLFIYENKIYLNYSIFQQYNLQLLICFYNRTKCQYTNYQLSPLIDFDLFQFSIKSIQEISIEEDLPIHSFITNIQLEYNETISNEQLNIVYKLLTHTDQFNLNKQTGIIRLTKQLKPRIYFLEIQVEISLLNISISMKTLIEINVYEINKYRPKFSNNTLTELFELPYRFQAFDYDENKQTNGRITYRLWNCFDNCPFQIHPNTGLLEIKDINEFNKSQIYHLQIIVFDWGQPISFETSHDIQINLSSKLIQQNSASSLNPSEINYLNIGFKQNSLIYHISEDAEINAIIDRLEIEYDLFPLFINDEKDNLFFYVINDISMPFIVDQNTKSIKLINSIDREKQDRYVFEIELKLKMSYRIKLNEEQNVRLNFQYSNKYYQKILITIYINDVNDNIPQCNYFHKQIFLYENQIHTNIFHVQAFDSDQGENGTIIYSLFNSNEYFLIDSSTGQINSIKSIDHEQISYFILHIITSDRGQQPQLQSLCMTLHIKILDINDNIPQFSLTNYNFEIFSDLPQETIFGQIYAADLDTTDNLIYSINSNPFIKINQNTGHLYVKSNLYKLINQNVNITVTVSDGLHINQTWIFIRIKRFFEPQQPILLSEPAYSITINRSISIGTIVTNIYQRLGLIKSSIDFIEIIPGENFLPFSIDQQGSIHLVHLLTDLSKSSYWISIRLTRYRAHPPHSYLHLHISIQEDNYYLPQCVNIYQSIKIYDYFIPYPIARIQAFSYYNQISFEYKIVNNEKIFSIDKQTGFIQLLPLIRFYHLIKTNYFLTIRAFDNRHHLFVDCYLKIHHIQRHELIPKFLYTSTYNIDLIENSSNNKRLRQRLFQIIALLDEKVYKKNLQIRYRITDSNEYFIINHQTGYIAIKKPLNSHTTYRFNVEAFTVVYRGKWRIVSSRVILSIKIRVLPIKITQSSLTFINQSIINLDLSTTTKVGSTLLTLGMNNTDSQWFIMTGSIEHTSYFHITFQTGELILIRPIEELTNKTNNIELHINMTNDWIHMDIIKIIIHLKNPKYPLSYFSQTDYYSSISKTISTGIEIARLTIENPMKNCTYKIHSTERIKSRDFFHINLHSGSVTILQSLEKSIHEKHLLNIIYSCYSLSHIAYTRLHINILDRKKSRNNSYRFSQENYLIIFEISLKNQQKKYLMDLELINYYNQEEKRIKPDAQIIEGDPLGLFSIDPSNQSLFLLDESRARSYNYPKQLIILDTSQQEPINCTIILFISNIALQFNCPMELKPSPYLFTYESKPKNSIDLFTGQQYKDYNSVIIQGFDPFIPFNYAECLIKNSKIKSQDEKVILAFEKDIYSISNPQSIYLSIKNRTNYLNPFDITYHILDQTYSNPFQLDTHNGIIKYLPNYDSFLKYSFLIFVKYQQLLITFTRLNIILTNSQQKFYKFQIYRPFIDNYTIGYINEKNLDLRIFDEKISSKFSIDFNGRLFIKNQTLIQLEDDIYDFILGINRIQIHISSKEVAECSLNRLSYHDEQRLIGFIEIKNSRKRSFILLNYNHLFTLDYQHGLLYYQNFNQIISNDLILLIDIENSRCFITIEKTISKFYKIIQKKTKFDDFNPRFYLDLTNKSNKNIFVGQLSYQPYNIDRSFLVYELLNVTNDFILNSENGIIEYIPNRYYNKTMEVLQVLIRDLIYQQNTIINITIYITKSKLISLIPRIYYQTISEILSPGSVIFQPNISATENLHYSLQNYPTNLFTIDSNTGQIILLDYLFDSFYSLQIHISPINQILILKLTVDDYNNHPPTFNNLSLNLTISSNDIFITKLSAYDLDLTDNQNLKYYLLDQDQRDIFSINQTSGIITLKSLRNQTFILLKIGVTDGLYFTTNYLPIIIYNYSKNLPKFSSEEYIFQYNEILGQITAYDSDLNDEIIYQLYLEPDGIQINLHSGLITLHKDLLPQIIEFYASASDRAQQIVYTKIKILFAIQPRFTSNFYYIPINPSLQTPSEIFRFQLVDSFNQLLSSTRFEMNPQTNFFTINENRLILQEKFFPSNIFYFNIYGYWKNFTCQTTIQIKYVENMMKLNKESYEFLIEKNLLKSNYFIEKFHINNSSLKILSSPLTMNNCIQNFYLKFNELYFNNYPILSDICFFELQLSSLSSSQMKISFIDSNIRPKFLTKIFNFYSMNSLHVFAQSLNPIRYKLQTNSYGLIINQTSGIISFKSNLDSIEYFDQIQLFVYAIDDKTKLNDTALINIILNKMKAFQIPKKISVCSNTSVAISDQSLPGTIIQDIYDHSNNSIYYYIVSGDKYGLFAINNLGKLYLIAPFLNKTSEDYFELIILISSSSISYCRANISIDRSPKWSYFICPIIPIEWITEEESPIGTTIGNIKEILFDINNNNSQLINQLYIKLNPNNDSKFFHLNSSAGFIHSKSRLDYEQQSFYSFTISLESPGINCSLTIIIKLLNIPDNPISIDKNSLTYTINENHLIPYYLGRIKLIDPDQLLSHHYKYSLKNSSTDISIDSTTGSIILLTRLNQKRIQYEISLINHINQKYLHDLLTININQIKLFRKDFYQIDIKQSTQPGTIIFQIQAKKIGILNYYLKNSSSKFFIEKLTGNIRLNEYLPSFIGNYALTIEVIENETNFTDQTNIFISIIKDNSIYFDAQNLSQCFLNKNQINSTKICTIGKSSNDFIYHLIDPMNLFDILPNNGTIINKKPLDYDIDIHEFIVTITVRDRKRQSIVLSSLNVTIHLRNPTDDILKENSTTLLYLYYPLMNTIVYKFEMIDNITYEILHDIYSNYILNISLNLIEVILNKTISNTHEDNIKIRLWKNELIFFDYNLRLIYLQTEIKYPSIRTEIIDGYINFQENSSSDINLGQLFIKNHSEYEFIYIHLLSNKNVYLKQLSNNQTEIYIQNVHQSYFQEYQIHLTAFALTKSIINLNFSNNIRIFPPSNIQFQTINIHLWSINNEMLNRTISIIIDLEPNTTYEQFILYNLPMIRENLSRIVGVDIHHVHIYTFKFGHNQIELLIAILRSTSQRYIHKRILYNVLKTSYEQILLDQCHLNSCENNAHCISSISLVNNRYKYFYSNTYQRLIPEYQWNIKCLCLNSSYGEYCQYQEEKLSPCSSNPCLPLEKCIEESSTLYSCHCRDDLCNKKHSFECININSPTCRNSSNTLTFDGSSSIRMNLTINPTQSFTITLSFRTQFIEGELIKLIYYNEKTKIYYSIIIEIIDGYIKMKFNDKILLQLNYLIINDSLWHDIEFSIDYFYSYYLLRLDYVFSEKILFPQDIESNHLIQLIMGLNFYGCLGNLSLNNQMIYFQEEKPDDSIEYIGTNYGCQLEEIIHNDLCSLYHPCYHGGICLNHEDLTFSCNCSSSRFIGRQCQIDVNPCQSHPCQINEQCISSSLNSNHSYLCIPLLISRKKTLIIGFILLFILCSLFLLCIFYYKRKTRKFFPNHQLSSSSTITNQIDGTMKTLLKSDYQKEFNHTNQNLIPYVPSSSSLSLKHNQIYINSLSNLTDNDSSIIDENCNDSYLFNHYHIPRSTISLPKAPLYARIVKTPKIINSTSKRTHDETNHLIVHRYRHASDSDLLNEKKSIGFSSFFQTDV